MKKDKLRKVENGIFAFGLRKLLYDCMMNLRSQP